MYFDWLRCIRLAIKLLTAKKTSYGNDRKFFLEFQIRVKSFKIISESSQDFFTITLTRFYWFEIILIYSDWFGKILIEQYRLNFVIFRDHQLCSSHLVTKNLYLDDHNEISKLKLTFPKLIFFIFNPFQPNRLNFDTWTAPYLIIKF